MRHLRAAAVLFHVAAVIGLSIPAPPPGLRGGRPNPTTEASIARWVDVAASLGLPRASVDRAVRSVSAAQLSAVSAIRAVFSPYARLVGAKQSWLMFGTVPTRCARLEIDVLAGGTWRPLYVARSDEHTWRRALFDQERMRTFVHGFAHRGHRAEYDQLVEWVAREVADELPEATRVRVSQRALEVPPPEVLARTHALTVGDAFWVVERDLREAP